MKLRNFHYINKKLLDDYIAAIDGYVYEEETQKLNETNQKTAGAKAGAFGVSGDGKYEKQSSEEFEREVNKNTGTDVMYYGFDYLYSREFVGKGVIGAAVFARRKLRPI